MATKYEYYDTGYVAGVSTDLRAQTFTPSVTHVITYVKLYVYAGSAKPDHLASIRATSGGAPTGSNLVTAIVDCSGLSGGAAGRTWLTATFSTHFLAIAGTTYALCFYGLNSTVYWCADATGAYTGGSGYEWYDEQWNQYESGNGDLLFEEWGNPVSALPSEAITRVTSLIHRYDRGTYTLELGLGEVIADFGLPEWNRYPIPALPEEEPPTPFGAPPVYPGTKPEIEVAGRRIVLDPRRHEPFGAPPLPPDTRPQVELAGKVTEPFGAPPLPPVVTPKVEFYEPLAEAKRKARIKRLGKITPGI